MDTARPTSEQDMTLFDDDPILRVVARERFDDDHADHVSCWELDGDLDAALAWCADLSSRVLQSPHLVELFACTPDLQQGPPGRGRQAHLTCLLLRSWSDGSGIPVEPAAGLADGDPGHGDRSGAAGFASLLTWRLS